MATKKTKSKTVTHVFASMVGQNGIKAGIWYELNAAESPSNAMNRSVEMDRVVGELLPPEMFDELMEIIDAKIATLGARDSSDGGLRESIRERGLVDKFENRFVADRGAYNNYRSVED